MAEENKQDVKKQTKYTFNTVKVALLLALICIGINTYVLWNMYGSDNQVQDPAAEAMSKLAFQIDSHVARIEQKLLSLEYSLSELPNNEPLLDEILESMAMLDELQLSIESLVDRDLVQEQLLHEIIASLATFENLLLTGQASLDLRISELENLLADLQSRNNSIPSDQQLVSLIVEKGDSIWDLASKYESPPSNQLIEEIMALNNITEPRHLHVGQRLLIPTK